ncbi:MAG: adenylate/guanylate cyclase domain-containing protein [Candidatus Neomarinimicrobiota bacterium]
MVRIRGLFSRTPLEYKILLILAVGLALGFGSYVTYTIQAESAALLQQHRIQSRLFAESLKSGIRNMMMSGRPSYVRSLVEEAREEFKEVGKVRLFNNESKEIFAATDRFMFRVAEDSLIPPFIITGEKPREGSRQYVLLKNEKACQECHGTDHTVRGALRMEFSHDAEQSIELAAQIAAEAFKSLMLSGKGEEADWLMSTIQSVDGVTRAQVYDRDGYYVAFGDDTHEVPEPILEEAAATFAKRVPNESALFYPREDERTFIFGLENEEKCQICHGADHSVRGMLVLSVDSDAARHEDIPHEVAAAGFKNMMLKQRAMYAGDYVDRVRRVPLVERFEVFDNGRNHPEGIVRELYVPDPHFTQAVFDDSVEQLILEVNRQDRDGPRRMEYREVLDDGEIYLTQIIPLINDEKCQACHKPPEPGDPKYERYGSRWKIRSAVKVSTSMAPILGEIRRNIYSSVGVGVFTVFAVGVILRIFMKIVVVQPLRAIGNTVRQVGQGNLAMTTAVASNDEIGILSQQINRMIQGLRERLHLTKFVSEGTMEAVQKADLSGVSLGGERRNATVLFSDIRGFTAYSEGVEPETVIEMLNTFLNEQAQIVKQYNGDIDKFVGDELMAVFQGEGMVEDAINCSIALQWKVALLNRDYNAPIGVGIGINAGPMVMGAMGSSDRMDYTVLGDNVNLGARLCSAAESGRIIVSKGAVEMLDIPNQFDLVKRKSISVKGKENPIEVYEVRYET